MHKNRCICLPDPTPFHFTSNKQAAATVKVKKWTMIVYTQKRNCFNNWCHHHKILVSQNQKQLKANLSFKVAHEKAVCSHCHWSLHKGGARCCERLHALFTSTRAPWKRYPIKGRAGDNYAKEVQYGAMSWKCWRVHP